MYFFIHGGGASKKLLWWGGAMRKTSEIGGGGHTIFKLQSSKSHYPSKISSDSPRSMLLALPNFDQTMWFSLSYFRPDPKFYPQFQTLQVLHSSLKTWWEQLPKKMLLGCVLLKVYFLTGGSLKAYSLYTVHISLYISLFQITTYSYIAYDKPFKKFR